MDKLKPLIIPTKKPYASSGISDKPAGCRDCKFSYSSVGFCPDFVGKNIKTALIFPFPTKSDVIDGYGLSGNYGYWFLEKFIKPLDWTKDNLLISHTLRCSVPYEKGRPSYPTAGIKKNAEFNCRQYDDCHGKAGEIVSGGLRTYSPNLFLITFDPIDVFKVGSYFRQIRRDFEKIKKFSSMGYRPCVLLGNEPAEMFAPYIKGQGSCKSWRGHWWIGDYEFGKQVDLDAKEFEEA